MPDETPLPNHAAQSAAHADTTDTNLPAAQPVAAIHRPAWKSGGAVALFLLVAVGGLSLDLWSKHWAFHTLRQNGHRIVIPHVLEFQTMFNKGALFGIGGGQTSLFLAASFLALVLVSWMFVRSDARRWLMHIALAGILAGALGNMYDRINVQLRQIATRPPPMYVTEQQTDAGEITLVEYPPDAPDALVMRISPEELANYDQPVGMVRDFIKIPYELWAGQGIWPWVFNVADMLLVGGVSILAIFLWRDGAEPQAEPAKEADPAARAQAVADKPLTETPTAQTRETSG